MKSSAVTAPAKSVAKGLEKSSDVRSLPVDPPRWDARLRARLLAARYDRRVDAGGDPHGGAMAGSALDAHRIRLVSDRERADVARALRLVLRDAHEGPAVLNPRVPVRTPAVLECAADIDSLRRRVLAGPVHARGMARLRLLLADGRGPLYRTGAGSLAAALRGVSAAL